MYHPTLAHSVSDPDRLLYHGVTRGYPFSHYSRYLARRHQLATEYHERELRDSAEARRYEWRRCRQKSGRSLAAVPAYNSESANRCWPIASARNKAPTMRSSLTSSSRVNRASRGLRSDEYPDQADATAPRRDRTLRVVYETRDR